MKSRFVLSFCVMVLLAACNKKEPASTLKATQAATTVATSDCGKEIITDKPVKAGETGIVLPIGTKICITSDNLEIRVTLPAGYAFLIAEGTQKELPIYATYTCGCSANSHCQVFFAEGMGFGCLQSSCTGSCTGTFTYHGYFVNRVVPTMDKTSFFILPEVQKAIIEACQLDVADYTKHDVAGVSFYNVKNETLFKTKATCDCEGTKACTLKVMGVQQFTIYYCDGPCNGCELTVN